jgi:branched-chain amino acid transport system substrate-binding protein
MSDELVGSQLGKYEIRAEIGRGGMGTVYLGYDPLLDRRVAIKVLAPHLVWEQGFVERFLREARAAARLKHPSVVTIYDVGQEGSHYYFVMEYIEGQTLAQVIRQRGAMSPAEVTAILRPLADALDQAHRQGLVHRDIKPGNIMVGPAGQVMLTDFGIARAAQEVRLTTTGTLVGTPEYMSPEQARGEAVDSRTDQYSLGVVAYEMLSGKVPFGGTTPHGVLYKQIHEPLPPIRQERPDLPAGAQTVLQQGLAKEPGQRYATVTAFAEALGRALGQAPGPAQGLAQGPAQAREGAEATADMPTVLVGAAGGGAAAPATTPPARQPVPPAQPTAVATAQGVAPAAGRAAGRRRSRWVGVLAGLAVLVVAALAVGTIWLLGGGEGEDQAGGVPTPVAQSHVSEASPRPPTPAPRPERPFECPDPAGCVDVGPGQPIHIGYLLATASDSTVAGIDSLRGVELALTDAQVLGHPLELVGEDTRCDAESGAVGAERLAGDPRLVAVVGPTCSNEARSALPILCERGIPVVSPSNTTPDLTAEDRPGEYWCYLRTAYNDEALSLVAARFAREILRVDRAATIHDGSPYAAGLQRAFAGAFTEMGGTIAAQEEVGPQGDGAEQVLVHIAETGVQFLYYPVSVEAGGRITLHAREVPGLQDVPLMGADLLFTPALFEMAGGAAQGFLWTSPDLEFGPRHEELVARYAERYGEAPLTAFYAYAYDATTMILAAIERAAVQDADGALHIPRGALQEHLHATRDLPGVSGRLTCSPTGDCGDPRIAIYEAVHTDPDRWNPGSGPESNPRKIWP